MSRIGEEDEVPPQFDNENNMNNNQKDDKSRASEGPSLEDLMRRLEKLTTKNNKLRRKAKGNVIPDFLPKPSTHRMHDPGSIIPYIPPKVFTDNQMS
jgi:hypothetical protein